MVVGCYSLDLYCEVADCDSRCLRLLIELLLELFGMRKNQDGVFITKKIYVTVRNIEGKNLR